MTLQLLNGVVNDFESTQKSTKLCHNSYSLKSEPTGKIKIPDSRLYISSLPGSDSKMYVKSLQKTHESLTRRFSAIVFYLPLHKF